MNRVLQQPATSSHATSIFESPVDELLHPELAIWRANVGAPVALDLAEPAPRKISGIDLISWNMAVGAGRLDALLGLVRRGAFAEAATQPDRPLVVVLQEAYRSDDSVPEDAHGRFHGGPKHPSEPDDVVRVAHAHGMSIRYAPSMRNGAHRSDRGNAILSTVPFGISHAFVLPYVRQRRVVLSAELQGIPDLTVMSAHLDVLGRTRVFAPGERAPGMPLLGHLSEGRVAQAAAMLDHIADRRRTHCLVMGADLNTQLGVRDPVVRTFVAAGLRPATRVGTWRHTFHSAFRMMLDHVLFRSPSGRIERVRVVRLDERAGDIGRRVFGSDHHPLLAHVDFTN